MIAPFPTFPAPAAPGTDMPGAEQAPPAASQEFLAYAEPIVAAKPYRWPLVVMAASSLLLVGWLIFRTDPPADAKAKSSPVNYSAMTAQQLAEDAGVPAANELARRISSGTPAEQVAATQVMADCRNPRLARNLAMAMTLQQQKVRQEIMRKIEREQRMMEEPEAPPQAAR